MTLTLIYCFFSPVNFVEKVSSKFIFLLGIHCLAGFTDYLDGYLARKFFTKTEFGKFFDPFTDKILTLSVFMIFLFIEPLGLFIFPVVLIVFREIVVTFLRAFCFHKCINMATEAHGKLKLFFQVFTQALIWVIFIFFCFIFEGNSFSSFISKQYLEYANETITNMPFHVFSEYFLSQGVSVLAVVILEMLPNLLVFVSMIITLHSGMRYFFENGDILKKYFSRQ